MGFYSYDGVPDSVIDRQHTTSTGETYSLRHNENLIVEMSYLGKGKANANSQGWERNSSKYFDALYKSHPEMFSKKNVTRMENGQAPIVDQKMITFNPNWVQFRNQALVHHHIGGDGEAVAIPQNAHKGQGEIHNHEKSAGITDNCINFSRKCALYSDSIGKTTSQLHMEMEEKENKNGKVKYTSSSKKSSSSQHVKSSKSESTRSDAVRSSSSSRSNSSQAERSQAVRNAVHSVSHASPDRSENVKNSIKSTSHGKSSAESRGRISSGTGQGK